MNRFCNLFNQMPYEYTTGISFIFAFLISIFLNYSEFNFSENAYYSTLSSIFQGLFSILALAGVFIIFKTEQLSRDIAKYDEDIHKYLQILLKYSDETTLFLGIRKYSRILFLLDKRYINEYIQELENLLKDYEEMPIKIEERYKNHEDIKYAKLTFLEISKNYYVNECKTKGALIDKNRLLIYEILKRFKLPFMTGMPLIIFAIYFLPLLNSNSKFWFHIPITIIIGTSIVLTILVVLEIMCVIWYSIWSEAAERTL